MTEPDKAAVISGLGKQWLAEAAGLRALRYVDEDGEEQQTQVPEPGAGPVAVHEVLLRARANLDRLEEIFSQAMTLASGARQAAREAADRAGDELDRKIVARSARAREFEGARERIAAANLDALGPRIEARTAQKLADMATDIEARIRLAYRGLDSLRADLAASLRHVSWESSLDR